MNIKRRITGKPKPFKPVSDTTPFHQYVGLVMRGVRPDFRGTGLAQQLMTEFENRAKDYHQNEMVLSAKKDNDRAIKVYLNFGWTTREVHEKTFVLHKLI